MKTWVLELPDTLNRIIKNMHKLIFLIFLCFFSLAIAEPESEEDTVIISDEQAEAQKDKKAAATVNTPDSFNPTETLSQDVPAAFPVDI